MSMPVKPTSDIEWASGSQASVTEPPALKKALGWIATELPPVQYFNWFMKLAWQWQTALDRRQFRTVVVTAAGAYAPGADRFLRVHFDSTLGIQSLTLPPVVAGADDGLTFEIKTVDSSTNPVTITGTVEGEVNPTIDYQWTGRAVYAFDGSWFWNK